MIAAELEVTSFAESQSATMGNKSRDGTVLHRRPNSAVSGEVWSPMLRAVKDNNTHILEQLLLDGHKPDERDSKLFQEYTGLHWAAIRGNKEVAEVLLKAGQEAGINLLSLTCLRGHTPKQLAEKNKDPKFVELLDRYDPTPKDQ